MSVGRIFLIALVCALGGIAMSVADPDRFSIGLALFGVSGSCAAGLLWLGLRHESDAGATTSWQWGYRVFFACTSLAAGVLAVSFLASFIDGLSGNLEFPRSGRGAWLPYPAKVAALGICAGTAAVGSVGAAVLLVGTWTLPPNHGGRRRRHADR